jgi:hypothetical protein
MKNLARLYSAKFSSMPGMDVEDVNGNGRLD